MPGTWGIEGRGGILRGVSAPRPAWRLLFEAYALLARAWRDLLAWHLGFEALSLAVFGPLAALMVRRFVAASGYDAVGNVEIAAFLLRPQETALLLALLSLRIALGFVRAAGFLAIGAAALAGRRLRAADAIAGVARSAPAIVALATCGLLALTLVLAPLAAVALLAARLLLAAHDINYYLSEKPAEYWVALSVGAALGLTAAVAALAVFARAVFALALVLVARSGALAALSASGRLLPGRRLGLGRALGAWVLASGLISIAANAAVHVPADWLVDRVADRLDWLAATLGLIAAVGAIVNFGVGFVASASLSLLLLLAFRDAAAAGGLVLPVPGDSGLAAPKRPALRRLGLVAGVAAALVWSAGAMVGLIENQGFVDRVEITAHRGASVAAPENTLAAIREAIAAGADYAEIDVQLTSDGEIVVNHDADLMRVGRSPLVVSQATLAELRAVDLGSSWGPEFAGQRVPTLDEVIDVAEGRIGLVVELKSYRGDSPALVRAVTERFAKRRLHDWALVMSLKYPEIEEVARQDPRIRRGYIVSASLGDAARLKVDFLAVSRREASDALIAESHARDRQVFVWTIDDPGQASRLIDRGVDNLITNDPRALRQLLAERGALSDTERLLLRFRHWYED